MKKLFATIGVVSVLGMLTAAIFPPPGGGGSGTGTGDFLADGTVPMTGTFDAGGNIVTNVLDLYVGNNTYFSNFVYFLGEIRSDMDFDQHSLTNLDGIGANSIYIDGTLDGGGTGILTNFANAYFDEINTPTLNATAFNAVTHSIGSATVTNNIAAITAAPVATNVVDMTFASRTVTLNDALTFLHVTNAIASRDMTHVLYLRAGGSDRALAIPATWQTNTYSPVPANITNGYLTKIYVTTIGATADAASQTNALVSFEYYKVP